LIKKDNIHVPIGVIRSGRTDIQVSENGRPEEGQSAHVVDEKQTKRGVYQMVNGQALYT
jgi:hypothetical protein